MKKNYVKKLISTAAITVMCASLAACGQESTASTQDAQAESSVEAPAEAGEKDMAQGEAPADNKEGEKPEGEAPDGEKPQGKAPDGAPGGGPGGEGGGGFGGGGRGF